MQRQNTGDRRFSTLLWVWVMWVAAVVAACGGGGSKGGGLQPPSSSDTTNSGDSTELAEDPPVPCHGDTDCLDQNACTWDERCEDGFCHARIISCDDFNDCTSDTCDVTVGCVFEPHEGPCDDGFLCTMQSYCLNGICVGKDPIPCDDDNPCTKDLCDNDTGLCNYTLITNDSEFDCFTDDGCLRDGRCQDGLCVYNPVLCNDNNLCTDDSCDPKLGCRFIPNTVACNDGDLCTLGDRCQDELCEGTPRLCNDDNPCTEDTCEPLGGGCVYTPNKLGCDDGIGCTTQDTCIGGQCQGGVSNCDDGNPCTADVCHPVKGCVFSPTAGACKSPLDPCSEGDFCQNGECVMGPLVACDDGDICTDDQCISKGAAAECKHYPKENCAYDHAFGTYSGYVLFSDDVVNYTLSCVGFATAYLSEQHVLEGSGTCVWEDAINPKNEVVAFSFVVDLTPVDIGIEASGQPLYNAKYLIGELEMTGALAGVVPIDGGLTTDVMPPYLLLITNDVQVVAPPSKTPFPAVFELQLHRDEGTDTCCIPNGPCFPVTDDVCAKLGGAVEPPVVGECCVETTDGKFCNDTTQEFCLSTDGGQFFGNLTGACCAAGACIVTDEGQCGAADGNFLPGETCGDQNGDGFADACPAPLGCGIDLGLVSCSKIGNNLYVDAFGTTPLVLGASWTDSGNGHYETSGPVTVTVAGAQTLTLPMVPGGKLDVLCSPSFAVTGTVGLPNLGGLSVFGQTAVTANGPSVSMGYALGQELADLGAPLSDCRPYLYFYANMAAGVTVGGVASMSLMDGSSVTLVFDPTDPAFFFAASGDVLSGPTGGLLNAVGAGLSLGGNLQWVAKLPLSPKLGAKPEPKKHAGHVYQSGEFGLIPIPGSPVQVVLDGDVVVNLGPFPQAGEAVLAGLMTGDLNKMQTVLNKLPGQLVSKTVMDKVALGANARKLSVVVGPLTLPFAQASVLMEGGVLRFAADGLSKDLLLSEAPAQLKQALKAFTLDQVYRTYGFVSASGAEISVEADLAFGPVKLEKTGLVIRYVNGNFSVEVKEPSLSFDIVGWLESFKDILGCDFEQSEAGCSLAGFPVGNITVENDETGLYVSMMAQLPLGLGGVEFIAEVEAGGNFKFLGSVDMPMGPFVAQNATLVLTENQLRVIGSLDDLTTDIVFDGTVGFDGSFSLSGEGKWTLLGFVGLDVFATLSGSGTEGSITMTGTYSNLFGDATVGGTFEVGPSGPVFTVTGTAEMDVFGFAGVDGTFTITNVGNPGVFVDMEMDIPLVETTLGGELYADGNFQLEGKGNLTIPGFAQLAEANVRLNPEEGIFIQSNFGFAGTSMNFAGSIRPDGFLFTGKNSVKLLGFGIDGAVTFKGAHDGGEFLFSGGLNLAGSYVETTGYVDGKGNFELKGKLQLKLFGYTLSNAITVLSNTGFSILGTIGVLGGQFTLEGKIDSSLDFVLSTKANANLPLPGGLNGDFSATLQKKGAGVSFSGGGSVKFLGLTAQGSFYVTNTGQFSFTGGLAVDWSKGPLSLEGGVSVSVSNGGVGAWFSYDACVDYWFDSGCTSGGASVSTSGDVCLKFPIKGYLCVDIF